MKKFRFNLESLLTLREWEEQKARQGLAEANAEIHRVQSRLSQLGESVDNAYKSWDGSEDRRFSAMDRMTLTAGLDELSRETEKVRKELEAAEAQRAKAMEALVSASRNRKAVSNLKSNRLRAYNAEVRRLEANEIEDVFNARRSVM